MAIDVGQHYLYIQDLLSKNNGVYISPKEYERYGNASSNEMFDDFLGLKTTPRIVLGKNRLVDSRLLPFKKRVNLAFSNELLTKPANCRYISAVYTTANRIPVRPLDDDRQARVFQDTLASPSEDDMYYVDEYNQLRLLGEESLSVTLEYYIRPTPIVYAYTTVNGRPVYDQANSTQYDWDVSEQAELTTRILEKAGLSMRDQLTLSVQQKNKNEE